MLVAAVWGGPSSGAQGRFPCDGEINTDGVNLRAGPSLNYEAAHRLDRGALVVVTGRRRGWYRVESPEEAVFYVSARYLSDGTVVCGRLNVRVKPSPSSTVVCQLVRGEHVEEIERDGEWAAIKAPDCAELWVSAELITVLPEEDEEEEAPAAPPAASPGPAVAETPAPDASSPAPAVAETPAPEASPPAPAVARTPAPDASSPAPAVAETPAPDASPPAPAAAETPSTASETTKPHAAARSAGIPCRKRGRLVRAEARGMRGAPYCLVEGFFVPRVVSLVDSDTVNLGHYEGDRVKVWGYERFRDPAGVPVVDVRRIEVE
jgi:SH3-like domain-containing protein